MNKKTIFGTLLVLCLFLLFSGCIVPAHYEPQEAQLTTTMEYVVKEKFQTTSQCGYGSATDYYILTPYNQTVLIATACGDMEYYHIWSEAEPQDLIVITIDREGKRVRCVKLPVILGRRL